MMLKFGEIPSCSVKGEGLELSNVAVRIDWPAGDGFPKLNFSVNAADYSEAELRELTRMLDERGIVTSVDRRN